MTAITNKKTWLQDKPNAYIPKGNEVEVLDDKLENNLVVVRHNGINCIIKKEDLDFIKNI